MTRICVGSFLLLLSGLASSQCPRGEGWQHVTITCMLCGVGQVTWSVARDDCSKRGGNLASILNTAQKNFADGCANLASSGVWMGLLVKRTSGAVPTLVYSWEDGSTFTAVPGVSTLPTTFTRGCNYIDSTSTWAEAAIGCSATDSFHYVCSRDEIKCQPLVEPRGSNVTYEPSTVPHYVGAEATYSCSAGHEMTGGVASRTCDSEGNWGGEEPECIPVDCGPLGAAGNGSVSYDSSTYKSVATYSCDRGYTPDSDLATSMTRTCLANASWSDATPTCTAVKCAKLRDPPHGSVIFQSTAFESIATYLCYDAYEIKGTATRTCMISGYWSGIAPTCKQPDKTMYIALGASFGGVAFVTIVIVVSCLTLRRNRSAPNRSPTARPIRRIQLRSFKRPHDSRV